MDLIDVLQTINQKGMEQMKLSDVAFGTVTSVSPLNIQIEGSMQALPEAALIKTVGIMPRTYSGTDSHGDTFTVTINEGLTVGSKVVMLRVSHGQRYIVLSKVY